MMIFITIGQRQRDKETGEPDDATSITSGSEGGWEKRPAMDLARSLPSSETDLVLRFINDDQVDFLFFRLFVDCQL